jgi:hypothetical protein
MNLQKENTNHAFCHVSTLKFAQHVLDVLIFISKLFKFRSASVVFPFMLIPIAGCTTLGQLKIENIGNNNIDIESKLTEWHRSGRIRNTEHVIILVRNKKVSRKRFFEMDGLDRIIRESEPRRSIWPTVFLDTSKLSGLIYNIDGYIQDNKKIEGLPRIRLCLEDVSCKHYYSFYAINKFEIDYKNNESSAKKVEDDLRRLAVIFGGILVECVFNYKKNGQKIIKASGYIMAMLEPACPIAGNKN